MLRVLLYVTLLGALFVGAVFWAGNAIGAWEPAVAPAAPVTVKQGKPKKHKAPAKSHRHRKPKRHAG
jgi:hypothetical protein